MTHTWTSTGLPHRSRAADGRGTKREARANRRRAEAPRAACQGRKTAPARPAEGRARTPPPTPWIAAEASAPHGTAGSNAGTNGDASIQRRETPSARKPLRTGTARRAKLWRCPGPGMAFCKLLYTARVSTHRRSGKSTGEQDPNRALRRPVESRGGPGGHPVDATPRKRRRYVRLSRRSRPAIPWALA